MKPPRLRQTKEAEVSVKGETGFLTRMIATGGRGGGSVSQGCRRTNAAAGRTEEDRKVRNPTDGT